MKSVESDPTAQMAMINTANSAVIEETVGVIVRSLVQGIQILPVTPNIRAALVKVNANICYEK